MSYDISNQLTDPEKLENSEKENHDFSSRASSFSGSRTQGAGIGRNVWLRMDWRILPVVAMFYLLSFLDRTNLGNARVAGLQKDLKITNKQYSIALTVTYVSYIAAELPSNLLLRIVGPNLMMPVMLTTWGVITALQGVVKNFEGLLACRFFLGLMEGGVLPGLVLYLSDFYPRHMLQTRVSAFFSTASLSGAFSGLLAYGIAHMDGLGSRKGWEWIFILEGTFTVVFGLFSFFLLPRSLKHCKFLSEAEKDWVAHEIKQSGQEEVEAFSWKEVGMAFMSPHVWIVSIHLFFGGTTLYSLAYFTPSIISGLGYTGVDSNLMTVPPFAVAFVFTMIAAILSDKFQWRGYTIVVCSLISAAGFSMFLASTSHRVQYSSLFLSVTGVYCGATALSTWQANNSAPHVRRATAIAFAFILTNSGGILSTWLYGGVLSPAPRYTLATRVMVAFCAAMTFTGSLNWALLKWLNHKKAEKRKTMTREQEEKGLGDKSAWFIYTL